MKPQADIKNNIKEALLRKLFTVIKENNYYGESLHENSEDFKQSIIREIEYFYIRFYHMEYVSIDNNLESVLDISLKYNLINSKSYYDAACSTYESIKYNLFEFCDKNKNKDKYRSLLYKDKHMGFLYQDKHKRDFIINALEIVQDELGETRKYDLYNDIYNKAEKIKKSIENESILKEYIIMIEKGRVDFLCESKDGKLFYPVMVDMYLDYVAIEDNIYINSKEIARRMKRYTEYIDNVKKGKYIIDASYYYFMKFRKDDRKENIKKHILQFYLDNFNNNENVNTLFRKLHLDTLDNDNRYTPSDMKKYNKKIHNFFILGANISIFI